MESLIDVQNLTMFFLANYDMTRSWTQSLFYNDVLQSVHSMNKYNELYSKENILYQNLFYNKYLKFDQQYFYCSDIVRAGIWQAQDLFDINGNFIPFIKFTERGVSRSRYLLWRNIIAEVTKCKANEQTNASNAGNNHSLNVSFCNGNKVNVQISKSREIYENLVLEKSELPKSFNKYSALFPDLTELFFENVCLIPRVCVKNNFLKELQYKIIHRYLPTNRLLYKMGKVDSMRCTLCELQMETINHLFYECTRVKVIWSYIVEALRQSGYRSINLECNHVVLGYDYSKRPSPKNYSVNNLILYAKAYIWHVRKYCIDISIDEFKVWLCNESMFDDTLKKLCNEMRIGAND